METINWNCPMSEVEQYAIASHIHVFAGYIGQFSRIAYLSDEEWRYALLREQEAKMRMLFELNQEIAQDFPTHIPLFMFPVDSLLSTEKEIAIIEFFIAMKLEIVSRIIYDNFPNDSPNFYTPTSRYTEMERYIRILLQ